ncbi:MAG TPA: hypothetical protein VH062_12905 [Polyangiaceae bacterium]|jgi:hypothetical protein|nr:hypothetical protein [Polyangiaceae bacterium]
MRTIAKSALIGVLVSVAVSCSHDDSSSVKSAPKPSTGKLDLALEATSDSGKVYRLRNAFFDVASLTGTAAQKTLNGETDPSQPVLETFLAPGTYSTILEGGWFVEQVDGLNGAAFQVSASLLSSQVQIADVRSDEETFVRFDFQVDGSRVTFGPPGRLIVGIGIHEREAGAPPSGLNPRRSLLETGQGAVSAFTLTSTLSAIQTNGGVAANPELLYRQIIDSYSTAPGQEPTATHCGDEQTGGAPSLNGFPITCNRLEAQQISNLSQWFPLAAVNRLDLAPADGSHCGQQRLIFANNAPIGNSRMFIIIEAQIPNPHPECGVAACRPLADFWAKLSDISDAGTRGKTLAGAYLTGDPDLVAEGFPAFENVANLSVGTGSIRTNNFDDFEWTLREFKVMTDPTGRTRAIPFPVVDAPHGALWNDTATLPAGDACRKSFITALDSLLSDDPAEMGFPVDSTCYDSESPNDGNTQNYPFHLGQGSGTFRSLLQTRLAGTGLTPEDVATRAQFAGSCIGCHEEANGVSLGHGVISPSSNGFVHVDEEFTEDCGDGTRCFAASPALTNVFLPRRLKSLQSLLDGATCGGAVPDGGVPTGEGGAPLPPPPKNPPGDAGAPSSVLTPGTSIQDLVDQDQSARDKLAGQDTLGGQPANVSH